MSFLGAVYLLLLGIVAGLLAAGEPHDSDRGAVLCTLLISTGAVLSIAEVLS